MSKLGEKVKSLFTVDYDDDYEDDYYDEYDDEEIEQVKEKPVRKKIEKSAPVREEPVEREQPARTRTSTMRPSSYLRSNRSSKVVPMRSSDMEVCVIKPTYYESTRDIIDTLLDGKAVVLNLEGMKLDLAQRIIDSVSGGCYAISGNLQKISGYIYLVTPQSVDITGDLQDLVSDSSSHTPSYGRSKY